MLVQLSRPPSLTERHKNAILSGYRQEMEYESNDPDWRVETSFTDITIQEKTRKVYTLTVCGPDKERYSFYENDEYLYSVDIATFSGGEDIAERMLPISEYCDARYDRKLVVNPEYAL